MASNIDQISGAGLSFPIRLDSKGSVPLTIGWELIRSSIYNILAYELGKRDFQRDFGASPKPELEEPNDFVTQALLENRLSDQLQKWDNRVALTMLQTRRQLNELNITIVLSLRNSNPIQTETFDFTI